MVESEILVLKHEVTVERQRLKELDQQLETAKPLDSNDMYSQSETVS